MAETILFTERLILREFHLSDWPAVHLYASDPTVVARLTWGPYSEKESRKFVEDVVFRAKCAPRTHYELAVTLRGSGQLIGGCDFTQKADRADASIGYYLNSQFWGMGLGTEISRALLEFGFGELSAHRITAIADPENQGSWRILEKLGLRREGYLRQHIWAKTRWRDSFLYAVLAEEWNTLHGASRPAFHSALFLQ